MGVGKRCGGWPGLFPNRRLWPRPHDNGRGRHHVGDRDPTGDGTPLASPRPGPGADFGGGTLARAAWPTIPVVARQYSRNPSGERRSGFGGQ
jgi:hypothetical protein